MRVALEADLLEAVGQPQGLLLGQVVQLGQLLVDEGVVRVQEPGHRTVLLEHVAEEEARLGLHRGRQVLGVVGAIRFARGRHAAELAQVQPAVEEAVDESLEAIVGQQAVDLLLEFPVAGEFARRRGSGEGLVGRRGRKGEGEAGGEVVRLQASVGFLGDFAQVQEGRGAEDEFDHVERRLARAGFFGDPLLMHLPDRRAVGVLQRAAVGFRREREELVEGAFGLEALFAEDGDLFGATHRLGHRALDDDLADADMRQLAFPEDVRAADA